jgi:1,4-alpha-glucan branching enzyme
MRSEFEKSYPDLVEKVKIIPNGLNVELYSKSLSKSYIDDPYIFYVGRIVGKKGVDLLVKAFSKLNKPDLKLIIEGSGEELENVKNIAKKLGIDRKVIFTNGKLSTEEKISAMKGAIFGVIPSRIEPFGIVSLEFMATGTPFIASKTGGLSDLLKDNETCLFFENGNIEDLASKMEILLSDSGLRKNLSENGRNEVQSYKWESISDKYYNCFTEIQ